MGGKSRKTGGISKALVNRIKRGRGNGTKNASAKKKTTGLLDGLSK